MAQKKPYAIFGHPPFLPHTPVNLIYFYSLINSKEYWRMRFLYLSDIHKFKNWSCEYQTSQNSCLFFFVFLGPHVHQIEVSRLGLKLELQLPAYTIGTATQDPSHICNPYHASQQYWILNPLSKARDWTRIFMDTSQVHYHWPTVGTPGNSL